MSTHIAILRGINVSGQKKILMTELKAMFEALKFSEVQTYIQSGNVIFSSTTGSNAALAEKIEKAIRTKFKFEVPVIVRSAGEWKKVISSNPFLKKKGVDLERLYVTFLNDLPAEKLVENLKTVSFPKDEFILSGKEIYLHCPGGYGNTKLSNTFFESKLKVSATTRNWKTVNELGSR